MNTPARGGYLGFLMLIGIGAAIVNWSLFPLGLALAVYWLKKGLL